MSAIKLVLFVFLLSTCLDPCFAQQVSSGGLIFVPNAPATQSGTLSVSEVSDTQLRISIGAVGSGTQRLIVAKLTSSATSIPMEAHAYSANSVFASGDNLGNSNYVVYKGTGNTILITGLTASTAYTLMVYEFNAPAAGLERYNTTSATVAQTTLAPQIAPTTQATSLSLAGDRRLSLSRGNGGFVLIVAHQGAAVDSNPVDNSSYTAGSFGSGSQIGTGNFVVYNGTASTFDVLGLTYGVSYGIRAYEYNLASGNPKYNTATATGNPLTASTPAVLTYHSYKDTPFRTRRDSSYVKESREFSQLYPTCDWIGPTKHHVWFVAEGDGTNWSGIDRTIRYTRPLASDPTVKASWSPDSPKNSDGDTPSFLDKGTFRYNVWSSGTTYNIGDTIRNPRVNVGNELVYKSLTNGNVGNDPTTSPTQWGEVQIWDGNQCWMMSVVEFGGKQYGIYVGNRLSADRYGVGMIVSTDEFQTYHRVSGNPIIASGANFTSYYVHVHPTKVGSYWYMFVQNYQPSLLVESHLYVLQIWRTTNDPTTTGWTGWTKLTTVDQLSGRGYAGAVDISQSWDEGGKFHAFISPNDVGHDGGYQAKAEGASPFKSTYPIGNKILEISWTDWTDFQNGHIVEREIYRDPQHAEIESRTWCQKRTFGSDNFLISMGFLWKGQTLLNGAAQMEPMNDGKILSTAVNTTGAVQLYTTEIYPNNVKFAQPHRSYVNDVLGSIPNPFNVITGTAGTVVGSPKAGRHNSIQAVNDGFVTFPNADFTYDPNYLAVKVIVGDNTINSVFGVCGMDTDVGGGQHGWHIRKVSTYVYEVWVYSSDNVHYKRYSMAITSNPKAGNDATLFNMIGFEFKNGVLKVRLDYNLNCTVTKIVDDSFTTMNVTNEPLRLGAIYPTTNDEKYCQDVVGSFLMWSGAANVTDANYLNTNLIGY